MKPNIFDYTDYRKFLIKALKGRGLKLELATVLACQSAYVSRILSGLADLSFEQAIQAARFFDFSNDEKDYFLMLVHLEKAATKDLKEYYIEKIRYIKKQRDEVASRLLERTTITEHEENILFSSWIYNAIMVGIRIPELRTRREIAKRFKLDTKRAHEIIEFLISAGLIREEDGRLKAGPAHIHQKKDSPNTVKSQINWRLQALNSMNHPQPDDLHFSGLYSLSHNAVVEIRRILIQSLEKLDDTVRPANDETIYALCLDWFRV